MKLFSLFKKRTYGGAKNDALSDFLLHASDKEKIRLFTKVAHLANKDQQKIVEQSKRLQAT